MELPRELYLKIGSYVNLKDYNSYVGFLGTLTASEYITLLKYRFPSYYKPSLNKYDIKSIYKSLLFLERLVSDDELYMMVRLKQNLIRNDLRLKQNLTRNDLEGMYKKIYSYVYNPDINTYHSVFKNIEDILSYQDRSITYRNNKDFIFSDTDELVKLLYELYRYLILEEFNVFPRYIVNEMYSKGDIEVFLKLIITNTISYDDIILDNCHKILVYAFGEHLFNNPNIDIKDIIKDGYLTGNLDINTTKILFQYVTFTNKEILTYILGYHSKDKESSEYLKSKADTKISASDFVEIITASLKNDDIDIEFFAEIWRLNINKLDNDQIIKIFELLTNKAVYDKYLNCIRKFIVQLSHHPAVMNKYL